MILQVILYSILAIALLSGLMFAFIGLKVRGKGIEVGIFILLSFFGALMFPLTLYRLLFKRDAIIASLESTKDMF